MKIFITGASGFVGGHVSRALVAQGHEVLAMARSDKSAAAVEATGARAVRGSLGEVDPADLSGVSAVVHCAAKVEQWGPLEDFQRLNVVGTQQLMDAAKEAGVGRFVHMGTENACFAGEPMVEIDETAPLRPDSPFPYSSTKAQAEAAVVAANGPDFTTVVLRPRLVWGPEDRTVLPAVLRILDSGGYWWLDGGKWMTSTCHIANLVAAVERALVAEDVGGHAFFIADDGDLSLKDFLTRLVGTAGRELPGRSMPGWLLRGVAAMLSVAWRVFRRPGEPPLTPLAVAMMSRTMTVKTGKAKAQLGWTPVISRDAGLAALAADHHGA